MSNNNEKNNTWLGIVLITLGVVFLIDKFGLVPYYISYYLFRWKTLFILIGTTMLITGRRQGFVFLIIGTVFLLPEFFKDFRYYVREWWPLIFLAVGVLIILKQRGRLNFSFPELGKRQEIDPDVLDEIAVFGGGEKVITSKNFRGGRITTIFGGLEIDLTLSELSPGENKIEVSTLFGGTTFVVPSDWTIRDSQVAVFGGFSDERRLKEEPDASKVLIIRGATAFGGVVIKN